MADSLDESVGKVGGNREEAPAFQNVHRGVRSVPAVSFPGEVLTGHRRHRCRVPFRGGSWHEHRL
jgi:predicted thioredoxin/glutaredoxin